MRNVKEIRIYKQCLKKLEARLEGMFNAKDAEEYIRDYRDVVSRIKPNETVFNLDLLK